MKQLPLNFQYWFNFCIVEVRLNTISTISCCNYMPCWDSCLCLLQEMFTFRVSGLSTEYWHWADNSWSHKALRPILGPLCAPSFTRALPECWSQNVLDRGPANIYQLHPCRPKDLHSIWLGIDKVYGQRIPLLSTLSPCSVFWGPEHIGASGCTVVSQQSCYRSTLFPVQDHEVSGQFFWRLFYQKLQLSHTWCGRPIIRVLLCQPLLNFEPTSMWSDRNCCFST